MRRKSERTATKKDVASPEKKIEKIKRRRSRRKKQSTSSENESADEPNQVPETEPQGVIADENPPKTPVKEDSPEETQDQIWRVKAARGSGDTGEITKLKICLTRPPSTPERVDRSPRNKRKQSRATSSSDATSVEAPEEKRKSKHHPKRSHRESRDEAEKNQDSQEEEPESEVKSSEDTANTSGDTTQSTGGGEGKVDSTDNTITTSNDDAKDKLEVDSSEVASSQDEGKVEKTGKDDKVSDADTTVVSPKPETTVVSAVTIKPTSPTETHEDLSQEKELVPDSPTRRRSASVDKSEILELHPEEIKGESDMEADKSKLEGDTKMQSPEKPKEEDKVSKYTEKVSADEIKSDSDKPINKTGVVESSKGEKRSRGASSDTTKDHNHAVINEKTNSEEYNRKSFERTESVQSNDEPLHNGQAAPIVVSRKRRWGSRSSKLTTQKSLTISTDVLKDIIPDVKPVEFEEVIQEKEKDKKHKREVVEKVERPILPKIVIDNTESVERAERERKMDRKVNDDKERDVVKIKDLSSNRKISIIKENDSIIARPPSPPRNKQSCILYITNLVRPFTLAQLKNLLQRTGRIAENGFWIDKIKSKCFVIYSNEEQAVETRHALHGVTWPVSNPKTLQVDFSTQEAFDKAKVNEDTDNAKVTTIPGTVEDWLQEQDMKRERGEMEKPWERKLVTREWDLGKGDKDKEKERPRRDERPAPDKRRHRTPDRSPEPARKFKKKEEDPPAKLLDDLFKKTKTTPCIYWLPLSAETIAIKEEQRRQHMAEHERRMQEQRRTHRRH